MKTTSLHKRIFQYSHILGLFLLIIITIVSTNYYKNYKENQLEYFKNTLRNTYLKKTTNNILNSFKPKIKIINHEIKIGDTLDKILDQNKIPQSERKKILDEIYKVKKNMKLQTNQKIFIKIDQEIPITIMELSIELNKSKKISFLRNLVSNNFLYREIEKNLKKEIVYSENFITNSLYKSAVDIGIKPNIIIDFARIYGFQVDFQRDIQKNDSFQIIYEKFNDDQGNEVETGEIIFANLVLQGQQNPLYLYKTKKLSDHFDPNGQSIRKTLMKTPINGARLSSGFGMRKHPILGFNKMHKGTDFAAPKGTPIMASGDGIITKAKWCGGGGNCIKIKHNSTYSTVYAHLSKFRRGIKKGVRVKQGQIIGYVGSTGMSTGPHLHYEVIENGKKINSQTLKLPSGKILKGVERKKFEVIKIKTDVLKSELIFAKN